MLESPRQDRIIFAVQIRVIDGEANFQKILPDGLPYTQKTVIVPDDGWVYLDPVFPTEVFENGNSQPTSVLEQATRSFNKHQRQTLPHIKGKNNMRARCELQVVSFEFSERTLHTSSMVGVPIFSNRPEYSGKQDQE